MKDRLADTIVGAGAVLTGEIVTSGPVRVEGEFSGQIRTEGHFVLATGGTARADVEAGSAVIAGALQGTLRVGGELRVLSGARVHGDLHAAVIEMEEGVAFTGVLGTGAAR